MYDSNEMVFEWIWKKGGVFLAVLCVLLMAACGYDYRSGRIPNFLIILITLLGMGIRLNEEGLWGLPAFLAAAALVFGLLYPFFKIGAVGAGDVKLLGVTAGCLPFQKALIFLFLSLLVAALICLVKMWKEDNFMERMWYLSGYLQNVIRSGCWRLYLENKQDRRRTGICMSGPVLVSVY